MPGHTSKRIFARATGQSYTDLLAGRGLRVDPFCPRCEGRGGRFRAYEDNNPAAQKWFDCKCVTPIEEASQCPDTPSKSEPSAS